VTEVVLKTTVCIDVAFAPTVTTVVTVRVMTDVVVSRLSIIVMLGVADAGVCLIVVAGTNFVGLLAAVVKYTTTTWVTVLCNVVGITVVFVPLTRRSVLVTVVRCVVVLNTETVATNVVEILLNTAPAVPPREPPVGVVKPREELVQTRVVLASEPVACACTAVVAIELLVQTRVLFCAWTRAVVEAPGNFVAPPRARLELVHTRDVFCAWTKAAVEAMGKFVCPPKARLELVQTRVPFARDVAEPVTCA